MSCIDDLLLGAKTIIDKFKQIRLSSSMEIKSGFIEYTQEFGTTDFVHETGG